jgi:hypothetical protein
MIIKSSTHTEDKLLSALFYNTVANLVTHLTGGILNCPVRNIINNDHCCVWLMSTDLA